MDFVTLCKKLGVLCIVSTYVEHVLEDDLLNSKADYCQNNNNRQTRLASWNAHTIPFVFNKRQPCDTTQMFVNNVWPDTGSNQKQTV